jgi:hypothetical protein
VRGQAGAVEGLGDVAGQARLVELGGAEVDADVPRRGGDELVPEGSLPAGLFQQPAADLDDLSALLGQADEPAGREQPVRGMAPAGQRLDPDDPAVGEVDQRLVVQGELVLAQPRRDCGPRSATGPRPGSPACR